MLRDIQTVAIMSAGMKLLRESLGVVETEIFIANVKNTGFDYTKWREDLWNDMPLHELVKQAKDTAKNYKVPEGVEII